MDYRLYLLLLAHYMKLSEQPLLTEAEQQRLKTWNNTTADYPTNLCLHQLFEAQVERTPDAIAVVFKDQHLSYAALNNKANLLAHHLQGLGVNPDVLVGIYIERSLEMVIGLLGILKAGGAYLPLESSYPTIRLASMLEDAEVGVLLSQANLAVKLPKFITQVVCLDTDIEKFSHLSTDNPVSGVASFNLAYVIYTSGSTGKPKGVMVPHQAITNHTFWMQENFPLDKSDKVLQKTSFSFDASVWEFYAPLIVGAQLIIAKPECHQDPAYLVEVIMEQKVTTVQVVPSLLRVILEQQKIKHCHSLKRIFCGGEDLHNDLKEHCLATLDASLCNLYGPTEACIDATFSICQHGSYQSIGRPIGNARIYILDEKLQLQPLGIPGELCIAGAGLARGYLNHPELTAEKFIEIELFGKTERIYKTGDLARWLSDGGIEYLGRIDHQVKLRGFRIELGEIESVLRRYPGVNEAVVKVQEDRPGDQRLVAYLTHPQHEMPNVNAIRIFLKEKLPEYMEPSTFVFLDKLPLTPNGKIDRKALPAPDKTRPELEQSYVQPLSPIEKMLGAIWRDILNIDQVGIYDNFFELGGHSLLAMVLCTKIEAKIGKSIPVEWIFKFPTVHSLSGVLEQNINIKSKNFSSVITALQAEGTQPPFFWLLGGKAAPMIMKQMDANQPFYFLHHQFSDGNRAKYLTVPEMAHFYVQNIQEIDSEGPYYLGGFSIGGMIIYEVACQLCAQGKKVALLFILDPDSISNDKKKQEFLIQNLSLLSEYKKLKNIGYITYFLDKTVPIKTKFQKKLKKIIIQTYFSLGLGKALPTQLHEHYLEGIYEQAILGYQPEKLMGDIEKATIIHINNREMEDWTSLFNGKIETYVVNCSHLQLLEIPHVSTWLKILKRSIKECMSK